MVGKQTQGPRYISVNIDKPRKPLPAEYYEREDWSADEAKDILALSLKNDGTYRIERGLTEAFILQGNVDVVLPRSIDGIPITEIGACAFDFLLPFRPPENEESIERHLLARSLTIPDTITVIGNFGIAGLNPKVTYIPATTTFIGNIGFYVNHYDHLTKSQRFEVDEKNPAYCSVEGSLYTREKDFLMYHARPYGETLFIPQSVKRFGLDSFAYGSNPPLAIHVPNHITEIITTPSRECLWVCSQDSTAYRAIKRNGYYAVTDKFGVIDDYVFDVLDSGEVTLICYRGSNTDLVVPGEFDNKPVTSVGLNPFPSGISSIIFPDTITTIAGNYSGSGLRKLILPKNLQRIGPNSFSEALFEKPVVIPQTCESIGEGSFYQSVCVFEGYDARVMLNSRAVMECFDEGRPPFSFEKYDEALCKAKDYADRLSALLLRLIYPYELKDETKIRFLRMLKGHQEEVIDYIVARDDLRTLSLLLEEDFFAYDDLEFVLERFNKEHYTQGVVAVIDYRHRKFERDPLERFAL